MGHSQAPFHTTTSHGTEQVHPSSVEEALSVSFGLLGCRIRRRLALSLHPITLSLHHSAASLVCCSTQLPLQQPIHVDIPLVVCMPCSALCSVAHVSFAVLSWVKLLDRIKHSCHLFQTTSACFCTTSTHHVFGLRSSIYPVTMKSTHLPLLHYAHCSKCLGNLCSLKESLGLFHNRARRPPRFLGFRAERPQEESSGLFSYPPSDSVWDGPNLTARNSLRASAAHLDLRSLQEGSGLAADIAAWHDCAHATARAPAQLQWRQRPLPPQPASRRKPLSSVHIVSKHTTQSMLQ